MLTNKTIRKNRRKNTRLTLMVVGAGLLLGFGIGFLRSQIEVWNAQDKASTAAAATFAFETPMEQPTSTLNEFSMDTVSTANAENRASLALKGNQAPDFTLPSLKRDLVTLSDYLGTPVIVNIWASWCDPCKTEMPLLQTAWEKYQDKGLVVLGVNATSMDDQSDVEKFVTEEGIQFPILLDAEGKVVYQSYGTMQIPTTYFIDASGTIQAVIVGQMTESQLEESIALILPVE